jgi:serine phosphatase RsbU (regulator of sigma subunit)
VAVIEASNLPIGLFCQGDFPVHEFRLEPGESMVVYSDGVSETTDVTGEEYGTERLRKLIADNRANPASALLRACRDDLSAFRTSGRKTDDVTLFVLARKVERV